MNSFVLKRLTLAMKQGPWILRITILKMHVILAVLQMLLHRMQNAITIPSGQKFQNLLMLIE
nr:MULTISPECIES: hypothetical protein [Aquitalea]